MTIPPSLEDWIRSNLLSIQKNDLTKFEEDLAKRVGMTYDEYNELEYKPENIDDPLIRHLLQTAEMCKARSIGMKDSLFKELATTFTLLANEFNSYFIEEKNK